MSSLEMLLMAADYVDRTSISKQERERKTDHIYAATPPDDYFFRNKNDRPPKRAPSRTSHNELEKTRRAHLRSCLDNLKKIVPLPREQTRHTTLGLLNQAKDMIQNLERRHDMHKHEKERLQKKNDSLKVHLEKLQLEHNEERKRRDSGFSSSNSSEGSNSDKDEELTSILVNGKLIPGKFQINSNKIPVSSQQKSNRHLFVMGTAKIPNVRVNKELNKEHMPKSSKLITINLPNRFSKKPSAIRIPSRAVKNT